MATSRTTPSPYTQSLLLAAYQATVEELVGTLHEAGHERIRHKHGAVFANLDRDGTRPSVLAGRARMGKAAIGELIDELENFSYVTREADPTDGRAKLVVPTERAVEVAALVHDVNDRIERRLRRRLGAEGYRTLRTTLGAIGEHPAPVQPRMSRREG